MQQLISTVLEIIALVRSGDLIERRLEALELVGNLLIQLAAVLEDNPIFADAPTEPPDSLEDCVEELETQLANPDAATVSPMVIMLVTQLAKLVIERLLKRA